MLLKSHAIVRESARISSEDFEKNVYLALSKMNVSCDKDEFLISFLLQKKDGMYFYEYSCIKPDFQNLIKSGYNFSDIKNQTAYFDNSLTKPKNPSISKNYTNNINITSELYNLNDKPDNNTNPNKNNFSNFNNINDESINKTTSINNSIIISSNETIVNSDEENSFDEEMNKHEDELLKDNMTLFNHDFNENFDSKNKSKLIKSLVNLTTANGSYLIPSHPSFKFCTNYTNTLNNSNGTCELDEESEILNEIIIFNSNLSTVFDSTLNPLSLEDVWYQTRSNIVKETNLTNILNLQLSEVICERNFVLAEFVLIFDQIKNSFYYRYRCKGSRKKDLEMKCKNKFSNLKNSSKGLDDLVNLKIEVGQNMNFISSFRFIQVNNNNNNITNLYEYSICKIKTP